MKTYKPYEEIEPILLAGANSHFWLFCLYMDYEFFSKRPFLKPIALLFQKVIDSYKIGVAIKIGVSLPPRAGKSYITSLFCSYWLGSFPTLSVMRNTCTATLYQKLSYDTRAIVKSKKYRRVFPNIQLSLDKKNIEGWNINQAKQVSYFGAGVEGTVIGFGANIAISDDLYKSMADALSTATNDKTKLWKESAHDSRMEKNCPEVYIGTRWAKNDVIGEAIERGYFKEGDYIKIPALIEGKSFCEEVKTTEEYLEKKKYSSPSTWNAEYMQDPLDISGLLLPIDKLKFGPVNLPIPPESILFKFAIVDPADKGGDKFSTPFIHVVRYNNRIQCLVKSVIHSTEGIESNSERVVYKIITNKIDTVMVEANGVGLAAALLIKKIIPPGCKLVPFNSTIDKDVRILSHYESVPDLFIFDDNYKDDPEYALFISDLTSFSKEGDNKHKKDAMDIICLAANVVKLKYGDLLYS